MDLGVSFYRQAQCSLSTLTGLYRGAMSFNNTNTDILVVSH